MTFYPLNSNNSPKTNYNQVNDMIRQINNEQTTKTFKQAGGNAIIQGKLPYTGGYGTLNYDSDGKARIIMGIQPDGTIGMTISKEGYDVINDLSW